MLSKRSILMSKNQCEKYSKEIQHFYTISILRDKIFFVIDSFQTPKFTYCEEKKKFFK